MTSEDPVTKEVYRHLLGRIFKVVECEANPEFVAKVARIQNQLSVKSRDSLSHAPAALLAVNTTEIESTKNSDEVPESQSANLSGQGNDHQDVPQEDAEKPSQIESDGPCFSSPKKEKEESYGNNMAHNEKPGIDKQDVGIEPHFDSPEQDEEDDAEDAPLVQEDPENLSREVGDVVDSGESVGYSSQETIVEDDFANRLEVYDQNIEHQEGSSERNVSRQSISGRIDLVEYSQAEWRGETYFAECMRHGYSQIITETGCTAMRRIRGDNYCGLRATCFQLFSQNLNVLGTWKNNMDDIVNIPQKLAQNHQCTWLRNWSFAGRLKVTRKKTMETMKQCLVEFCEQLNAANSLETYQDRTKYFLDYFNSKKPDEVLIFEAVKLLMLHAAVLLHEDIAKGKEDVPLFATLLFLRDTCETPEQLMSNHLNTVGDTGGLEQVEMFLLGYSLNLTIRVLRPSKVEDDFISYYPDDHKEDWAMCDLIAEDDRHYNILVQ